MIPSNQIKKKNYELNTFICNDFDFYIKRLENISITNYI